jgi:glycine cleavage system H protein
MEFPADLKYTENDEWIRVDGNVGVVGITDFAQAQLSEIVFVEFTANVGETVPKGESFAAVESVKAAADVYMPVAGKILEFNDGLPDSPERVNSEPYGGAWMARIEIADPAELETLLDATAYEKICEEKSH